MKIRESKNLKYDKMPWEINEGYNRFDPSVCSLGSFERVNDKLDLFFRNGSQAAIKAINIEGGREIDSVENGLNNFLGKSYEDILNSDF